MAQADPITLALVQNRLDQIAKQMGWVMIRTSRSPIFNQSHDFSCFLTDAEGTLVSQADGIPIHTGGGGFAVRALLKAFAGRISEDDAFLLNDPYVAGGNHLPDWVVARPVFAGGTLVAFACNRAHQSDIGGGAAGTYNPQATEIFHEGIRLPPLKLVEHGMTRDDLWQLLMINSRCPELLDGDLRAMLGATRVGADELRKVIDDFGLAETVALFGEILDYADRRLRAAILELPDGVYRAEERYDNDCFSAVRVALRMTLTKSADRITVDFTGTDPQIRGFKNSSLANTYSAVYAGIASFFDSDLPRNEGTFRSVSIVAPRGSVVNAVAPAPLTMCTVFPAHEIMHMVWWAGARTSFPSPPAATPRAPPGSCTIGAATPVPERSPDATASTRWDRWSPWVASSSPTWRPTSSSIPSRCAAMSCAPMAAARAAIAAARVSNSKSISRARPNTPSAAKERRDRPGWASKRGKPARSERCASPGQMGRPTVPIPTA
jgi:N-methylhydantoinase B